MSVLHAATLADKVQRKYGYTTRRYQVRATESICAGNDTAVIAPCGYGKSLLLDTPLLVHEQNKQAMVVIVSPLKALQVEQAQK
jgi:superfamily II DNA helicase RecQ